MRVHLAGVGGAFGGREDVSMQIHAALLALHTNRAVKIVYNREESFTGHVHRHPSRIWAAPHGDEGRPARQRPDEDPARRRRLRLELDRRRRQRRRVRLSAPTTSRTPSSRRPSVYTNNPPCGAMRGFGAVQTCFAAEAQMDKLAAALGIDPIELRLLNAIGARATRFRPASGSRARSRPRR